MIVKSHLFLNIVIVCIFQLCSAVPLKEQLQQMGYVEMHNKLYGALAFDSLYGHFDILVTFLQTNPAWSQKLYSAKERYIRSKEKNYYSTDFFGFYDESKERSQIAFYYSPHFHQFICSYYPEFNNVHPIINFLNACNEMQQCYYHLCTQIALDLGIESIFSYHNRKPPILFKVIKYLPSYHVTQPHYDGTAFSLFLDSTDNQSLLMSAYKPSFDVDDFYSPLRTFVRDPHQNSLLLIPGSLLKDFSFYPTPHIVIPTGKTRYATIGFVMRPHYSAPKNDFTILPNFKH